MNSNTMNIVLQESSTIDSSDIRRLFGEDIWFYEDCYYDRDTAYMGIDSAVIGAFAKANAESELWGTKFKGPSRLITNAELTCLFADQGFKGWEYYQRKYSSGFYTFYRPGIYGNYALVDYWYGCGSLCGNGSLLLLEKIDGQWIIIKQGVMIVA